MTITDDINEFLTICVLRGYGVYTPHDRDSTVISSTDVDHYEDICIRNNKLNGMPEIFSCTTKYNVIIVVAQRSHIKKEYFKDLGFILDYFGYD